MLPIEILVQAVIVVRFVLQEQRRRSGLARLMTAREKFRVIFRISRVDSHCLIPSIRDRHKLRVDCRSEFFDKVWQRVVEVLVLSASETMARHYDMAAKDVVLSIEICYFPALLGRKNLLYDGTALIVKIARHAHRANLAPSFVF